MGVKNWGYDITRAATNNLKLVWLGVLGVLLIAAGGLLPSDFFKSGGGQKAAPAPQIMLPAGPRSFEDAMEAKMANLLSQIKGAGSVAVSITLDSGAAQEYAKNIVKESRTIQEKDTSGGTRATTETKETESILVSKENGIDRPVMVREFKPVIKGVLVIADGAGDSLVKAQLTKAVEASLGIPPYKITVLPQRK